MECFFYGHAKAEDEEEEVEDKPSTTGADQAALLKVLR